MGRGPSNPSGNAKPITVRMEPDLIARLDGYAATNTRGNRSTAVVELLTYGLDGYGDARPHVEIPNQMSLIDSGEPLYRQEIGPLPDPEPVVGTPVPAHLKQRVDDAAERARQRKAETCTHSNAKRSTITSIARCEDCGATQAGNGPWRLK
jgi:hypothetical protein